MGFRNGRKTRAGLKSGMERTPNMAVMAVCHGLPCLGIPSSLSAEGNVVHELAHGGHKLEDITGPTQWLLPHPRVSWDCVGLSCSGNP